MTVGNATVSGFTQFHHAEKIAEVPYRYEKYYDEFYIGYEGEKELKRYSMLVRRLDLSVSYDCSEFEKTFVDMGIRSINDYNGLSCMTTQIKEAVDESVKELKDNYGRKTITVNGNPGYKGVIKDRVYDDEYVF